MISHLLPIRIIPQKAKPVNYIIVSFFLLYFCVPVVLIHRGSESGLFFFFSEQSGIFSLNTASPFRESGSHKKQMDGTMVKAGNSGHIIV